MFRGKEIVGTISQQRHIHLHGRNCSDWMAWPHGSPAPQPQTGEQALVHLTSNQLHWACTRKEKEEGQKNTLFTSNSAFLLLKTFTEASHSGSKPLLFGFFTKQFLPWLWVLRGVLCASTLLQEPFLQGGLLQAPVQALLGLTQTHLSTSLPTNLSPLCTTPHSWVSISSKHWGIDWTARTVFSPFSEPEQSLPSNWLTEPPFFIPSLCLHPDHAGFLFVWVLFSLRK